MRVGVNVEGMWEETVLVEVKNIIAGFGRRNW